MILIWDLLQKMGWKSTQLTPLHRPIFRLRNYLNLSCGFKNICLTVKGRAEGGRSGRKKTGAYSGGQFWGKMNSDDQKKVIKSQL